MSGQIAECNLTEDSTAEVHSDLAMSSGQVDAGLRTSAMVISASGDDDHKDGSEDDSDDDTPMLSCRKRKSHAVVLDDSDEEENEEVGTVDVELTADDGTKNDEDKKAQTGSALDCMDDKITKASQGALDDLYDAELDDSDDDANKHTHDATDPEVSDTGQRSDGEEEDEEPQEISEALRRRLAKGASKKPQRKSVVSAQKKKDEMRQLHSESQRLVRESQTRMPYHQPAKVDLSVFLARTQQKQAQLGKNGPTGISWKHSPDVTALSKRDKRTDTKPIDTPVSQPPPRPANDNTPAVQTLAPDELPDLDEPTANEPFADKTGENVSDSKDRAKLTEDSGYLSTPVDSPEEEGGEDSAPSVSAEPESTGSGALKHGSLTPVIGNPTLRTFTPKLSGSTNEVIDLDAVPPPVAESGVQSLMERLLHHSKSAPKKSTHDVQISTVQKTEAQEGKREELTLETFTYHVEEEDEPEDDPSLQLPGAKLMKLKEKLQEKMKVKRTEARQKRYDAFDLDNEEGFKEDEDEGELTDQTDTDGESDDGEEEEEVEEIEDDIVETAPKKPNPFVDDEADEDDIDDAAEVEDAEEEEDEDDHDARADCDEAEDGREECVVQTVEEEEGEDSDDNEDDLHLQLEDADTESIEQSNTGDYSSTGLNKAKSFQLFDEDANTESPSMSQTSKTQKHEISDRPFEQLSGSSSHTPANMAMSSSPVSNHMSASPSGPDARSTDDDEDAEKLSDDKDEIDVSLTSLFKDRDTSVNSIDTSFEMGSSMLPAGQRPGRKYGHLPGGRYTPDLFTPSSKSSGILSKSTSKQSVVTMPIENTQDLLARSPSLGPPDSAPRPKTRNLHFGLEDESHSQMLDADGLLKVEPIGKSVVARRQLLLDSTVSSSGTDIPDMTQDLLQLCSGTFTESTQVDSGPRRIQEDLLMDSQSDQMLNCSGGFPQHFDAPSVTDSPADSLADSPLKRTRRRRRRIMVEDDDDSEASKESFEVTAGQTDDSPLRRENLESDSDDGDDLDPEDRENTNGLRKRKFALSNKHGILRKEFVENEAELSGSDAESDEDDDLDEGDDILECEAGDEDNVGSEGELRQQVERVHMKAVLDSDKKELRLLQEMYLQDGDLHSDGAGRMRRFRWKNIDEDTQQDMFDESDGEAEDQEMDTETKWRAERFQREKFLEEMQQSKDDTENNSGLIKLGKMVLKQKTVVNNNNNAAKEQTKEKNPSQQDEPTVLFKKPKTSHGSFLKMGRESLAKIAEMIKPMSNPNGPRHSKSFLFTAVSPSGKPDDTTKKRLSHVSSSQPPAKKPKLQTASALPRNSIFHHF